MLRSKNPPEKSERFHKQCQISVVRILPPAVLSATLKLTATSSTNGFLLSYSAFFGTWNKPAFLSYIAENTTARNSLTETTIKLLLRFVWSQYDLSQDTHLLSNGSLPVIDWHTRYQTCRFYCIWWVASSKDFNSQKERKIRSVERGSHLICGKGI